MTVFRRFAWFASSRFAAGTVAAALAVAPLGCKSKDSGGPSNNLTKNDPLIGGPGRIPKQNVPVPDRGGTAGNDKRSDPLLGSPTSGTRANAGGFTDDPARWKKGPYVPGPGGSPAALAGKPKDDGEGLAIELPGGVGLTPAGGAAPAPAPTPQPLGSDAAFADLAKFGVKRGDYNVSREDGIVVVRVKVSSADGPARSFTGQGATEAAAVKQVVEQLKSAK
jgi:hypothetical protein